MTFLHLAVDVLALAVPVGLLIGWLIVRWIER